MQGEIVIILDGPISSEIRNLIDMYSMWELNIKTVVIPENVGLGAALCIGLNHCSYDIVARMDSDDVSFFNRFEIQYNFLTSHHEVAVLGSQMITYIMPKVISSLFSSLDLAVYNHFF